MNLEVKMRKTNFSISGQLLYCLEEIAEHMNLGRENALALCINITLSKVLTAEISKKSFEYPRVSIPNIDPGSCDAVIEGNLFTFLEYISLYLRKSPDGALLVCITEGYANICQAKNDITPTRVVIFEPVF
ncbi:MAG: hypothetical protein A3J01_01055 [Candidatus Yanofskybacteria bacterium RIFCSPLOWO2_02_FULL_45_18]|uniref:Uncharacterized protein n=1 Tax=Candidatus Yanofskybacteria bacterium RIFCSPLOWO2_02_FULL_45_18 TaxID=1802707 RepID=A0A1F8H3L1_9BACT|nr:MAG: hypothetical protein A3J01_01055 [Candidatus Yanofskybacteria bacterium RIFCSPLOWO2_02_FULL_45_18]